jgi:hypothetical protein
MKIGQAMNYLSNFEKQILIHTGLSGFSYFSDLAFQNVFLVTG